MSVHVCMQAGGTKTPILKLMVYSTYDIKVNNNKNNNNIVHTEHSHVLPCIEVPVAPVGPVAMQSCILLVIISRLRAKGVNHSNMTPAKKMTDSVHV